MTRFGFSREPAVWVGAITSLLLVAADFGFHLTGSQAEHLLAAVPVLMALFIRQTVTPNRSVPAPVPATAPETTVNKPIEVLIREAVDHYQQQVATGNAGLESVRGLLTAVVPPITDPPPTGG